MTPQGTYADPIRLDTPYGPLDVWYSAEPSRVRLDTRGTGSVPRLMPADPPSLHAVVRSPECADDATADPPTERGYIDGRRGYWPLTINGVPYSLDGYYIRQDSGAWTDDRAAGYYTKLRRLGAYGDGRAVVTFGNEDPTDKARAVVARELVPLIVGALAGMTDAHEAARDRAAAEYRASALGMAADLRALADQVADLVDVRRLSA